MIGKHGVLATEEARDLGRQSWPKSQGEDPSANPAARTGMTVSEICDWYLGGARRSTGWPKPPTDQTIDARFDEGRIKVHIKPLIGAQAVKGLRSPMSRSSRPTSRQGATRRPVKAKGAGGQTEEVPAASLAEP